MAPLLNCAAMSNMASGAGTKGHSGVLWTGAGHAETQRLANLAAILNEGHCTCTIGGVIRGTCTQS